MAQGTRLDHKAFNVMDLQITRVTLSKEIHWSSVQECRELYVEMMRNRITIDATVSFEKQDVDPETGIMFEKFMRDVRKRLDANNVGLYAFSKNESFFEDGQRIRPGDYDDVVTCNSARGSITIFFEDHSDYARFVREHGVMFKLTVV